MGASSKHKVVAVDNRIATPKFDFEYEYVEYDTSSAEELPERIKEATIVITTSVPITRAAILGSTSLQLVLCTGTGTDHVDKDAIREKKTTLCHVPGQNAASVSEHALALYYGLRRRLVELHQITSDGRTWATTHSSFVPRVLGAPRVNDEETVVVIGYGAIGKRIESMALALGMKAIIAERKGATSTRPGRMAFYQALQTGTVFFLVAPLDASTRDMIGAHELQLMNHSALIVNTGRGGLFNELAAVAALRAGEIGGIATDVFEHEPATNGNSPLLDSTIPRLLLTPHVAGFSARTVANTLVRMKEIIEGFVAGQVLDAVIVEGQDCKSR